MVLDVAGVERTQYGTGFVGVERLLARMIAQGDVVQNDSGVAREALRQLSEGGLTWFEHVDRYFGVSQCRLGEAAVMRADIKNHGWMVEPAQSRLFGSEFMA